MEPEGTSPATGGTLLRVAVVTGAGRGLGRAEALELAGQGFHLVVNDLDAESAHSCASQIESSGGTASVCDGDVADARVAQSLIGTAVDSFGRLDVLVNNAGVTADRMVFNMSEDEWDRAIRVNLRSTFLTTHFAAQHWRSAARSGAANSTGRPMGGRIINTTSRSGLFGNAGQCNYAAAKAGVASFTMVVARELQAYGVTCNAIAPRAYTEMMRSALGELEESQSHLWPVESVARFVGVLASDRLGHVSGQVFIVYGSTVELVEPWKIVGAVRQEGSQSIDERADAIDSLFEERSPSLADFRASNDYPLRHPSHAGDQQIPARKENS